jgi:hypothetical protein
MLGARWLARNVKTGAIEEAQTPRWCRDQAADPAVAAARELDLIERAKSVGR